MMIEEMDAELEVLAEDDDVLVFLSSIDTNVETLVILAYIFVFLLLLRIVFTLFRRGGS